MNNCVPNALDKKRRLNPPLSVHSWVRFLARFLIRFLARCLTRVFGQGDGPLMGTENTVYSSTGTDKYSVQHFCDGEIQFYSCTRTQKKD